MFLSTENLFNYWQFRCVLKGALVGSSKTVDGQGSR